ncbi:BEM2 GTPase-activating protein BEM2/IPL2 [Candida maltosa Xu316]
MRKIWNRRDKDKRKSINSPLIYSNNQFISSSDQLHHNQQQQLISDYDFDDNSSLIDSSDKYSTTSTITTTTNPTNPNQPSKNLSISSASSSSSPQLPPPSSSPSTSNSTIPLRSALRSTNNSYNNNSNTNLPPPLPNKLSSLIKSDHDNIVTKHNWINTVVTGNDINENNLRLFRAELKGSHLYLYKSNPNLNIKCFKLDEPHIPKELEAMMLNNNSHSTSSVNIQSTNNADTTISDNATANTLVENKPIDTSKISSPIIQQQPPQQNTTREHPTLGLNKSSFEENTIPSDIIPSRTSSIPNTPVTAPASLPITSSSDMSDFKITYFKTHVPHPDLHYDFGLHRFLSPLFKDGKNTLESIIHFIFFTQDHLDSLSINTIINILPILPDFGQILKFISIYLSNIVEKKFEGTTNLELVVQRILHILENLEENFDGYLLKSDIAPYILIILERINSHELEDITNFKNKMLQKQQLLIDLVNNDNLPLNLQPFEELNSEVFMKDVNLIDFAYTISEIDLRFFNNWNSNIDKSLLLYSSISDESNRDFFYKKNPLIFNNDYHIHYLSRLLINHLFIENSNPNLSSASLENKARLLEKWIDLGCLLDKSGNMSSWLGISSVILSQPVLRLTKIWSLVTSDYIKLLKNDWSPVLFELDRRYLVNESSVDHVKSPHLTNEDSRDFNSKDSYHIMAPRGLGKIYPKERVIPYFGDLVINNTIGTDKSIDVYEMESIWKRINYSFDRWNDYLANLSNHDDIIRYNDDVIRRYDSMGFIFSNESLNQVLYLGSNSDDKQIDTLQCARPLIRHRSPSTDLKNKLLRLIELNCDSINLEKIMKLSVNLEPELPEAYLNISNSVSIVPNTPLELSFLRTPHSRSSVSINSIDSATGETTSSSSNADFNPASRIPTFNNKFFKIKLSKYDELTNADDKVVMQPLDPSINKHNFVLDGELTFRIDDFIADLDNFSTKSLTGGAIHTGSDELVAGDDDDDVPGLGIDVDDILNSDKFANISISPKATTTSNFNKNNPNTGNLSVDGGSIKKIYKFIPKYATVDKLVDLLLLDSRYFHRDVYLDLTEYRFVFLLNYNSFMTTKELLEKLAHRFVNSGNAVISVMKKNFLLKKFNKGGDSSERQQGKREPNFNQGGPQLPINFPNWNLDPAVDLNALGEVDYELLLKIQINILKVLIVLINNFYSNFSLDLANKNILIKLLKLFSNEILQWYNSNKIDNSLERSFESLVTYYKKLKKLFVKKTYRPVEISKFDEYLINEFRFNNSLHEVPMNRNLPSHRNVHKIEKFLYKFNKLLTVFYKGIKAEDWVKVYKILENSFEKNALLDFSLQKVTTTDDYIIVSNIFNYFESLVLPSDRQLLLKSFPLVFRKLFKVYFKFKSYLLVQLTDLNITTDERLDRMKTLLIMAKVSKLKMSDNQFVFEGVGNIPSCIETAIINVIYSPESRMFSNLWVRAAQALSRHYEASFDDVDSLLPPAITNNDLQSTEPLLPCFGWIIENLMETDRCPSYYKNMINFNKRYLIYKLIRELSVEDYEGDSLNTSNDFNFHESREFDFLLKLDESLVNQQNLHELAPVDKIKIFRSVLKDQHHILILDNQKKSLRDLKSQGGHNNNSSSSTINNITSSNNNNNNPNLNGMSALARKTSNNSLKRQSITYKSTTSSRFKISGLFTKSRPFSLSANSNGPEKIVDVKDLPNPDSQTELKQKPALVIPLKNKKIFPVFLMPLCFKIDSESGNEQYFFQATSDVDLNDWLVRLNYTNRHWFFSRTLNLKTGSNNVVFGVPISFICLREQSKVPKFLQTIFEEIEDVGIKDVGVYRISSSISELMSIKQAIDKAGTINLTDRGYDVHALTSVVKSYFRELPDALLTDGVISRFFEVRQDSENIDFKRYHTILKTLPMANYNTLQALVKHLHKISEFSETNKMTPSNIATVIGPALTEASNLDILINNFGFMNLILERLIIHCKEIFSFNEVHPPTAVVAVKDDQAKKQSSQENINIGDSDNEGEEEEEEGEVVDDDEDDDDKSDDPLNELSFHENVLV